MTFDLVVTGGLVITPSGALSIDIGISDGRIVALAAPNSLTGSAHEHFAADQMIVVPGGIDPHIHCNSPPDVEPGVEPDGAPPEAVSAAALWGGTTTLLDFAWRAAHESMSQCIERYTKDWVNCFCDYSYHVALRGKLTPGLQAEVPHVIEAGFPSFKVFTTDIFSRRQAKVGRMPIGSIYDLLTATAANNGLVAVHAEEDELVMHNYERLSEAGKTHYKYLPVIHSSLSEDLSFRTIIRLAQQVPGAALYMMHVSAASGVEAIAEARRRGQPVYGETLHQYALRTEANYLESDGMKYHTYPSLKTAADADAIWRGVATGDIATFATDELCTTYAAKTSGARIDDAVGGNTGVEPRMAIVFTEVVNKRKLGLTRFVEVTSTNAAKVLGLFPQKGVIAIGSDADLAIMDPNAKRTIAAANLHESDYSPWEGWQVDAWPVATILRGRLVVSDGVFRVGRGSGQLVKRRLHSFVTAGTAVARRAAQ